MIRISDKAAADIGATGLWKILLSGCGDNEKLKTCDVRLPYGRVVLTVEKKIAMS